MFFFGRKKKDAKDPTSKQHKWQMAELISGKHIRYYVCDLHYYLSSSYQLAFFTPGISPL